MSRPAFYRRPRLRWRESLVACDIGGTLVVKLLGFIEDQQAELLEVTENHMRLRIGRTWWERWWHGLRGHAPLEVRLDIRHTGDECLKPHRRMRARHSEIDVAVQPMSPNWNAELFETHAERVVHRLRRYLLAG